jgi:hypothetical protein
MAIQGQGRRFGSPRSSGGRNWSSAHPVERGAEPFSGSPKPIRADCKRDAEETLSGWTKPAAG